MELYFSNVQFELAQHLAKETLSYFKHKSGHYTNNFNSHLRGKVGEIAACSILEKYGLIIEPLFMEFSSISGPDLIVSNGLRVEVKTWSSDYWLEMGRCVAVDQFPKLRKKADCVLWLVSDHLMKADMKVAILGWSSLTDIANSKRHFTGPASGRKVENFQVEIDELRPITELLSLAGH